MKPTFFVFCEGKTEKIYIEYLRSKFRIPILIDPKIAGNRITNNYIKRQIKDRHDPSKDYVYLVYDLDVPEILKKLQSIKNSILLCSNPSFELWYLLHFQEQKANIDSNECERKLKKCCPEYEKGKIHAALERGLEKGHEKAVTRASKLKALENPSTQMYQLIRKLESLRQ